MSGIRAYVVVAIVACVASAASALVVLEVTSDRQDPQLVQRLEMLQTRIAELEARPLPELVATPARGTGANEQSNESVTANLIVAEEAGGARSNSGRRGMDPFAFNQLMDPNVDPDVRRAQAREMLESSVPPARMMAIRALVELGDPQALEAIEDFVANASDDPLAQRMAARVVDLLGEVESSAADAQLYDYLDHEIKSVQLSAARQLEERGDASPMAQMVDQIAQGLESDDGGERSRAAQELGRTRSASAVVPLVTAVHDQNSEVRLRAVQSLGRTADESAVPALTSALEDPVAEVRSAASRSLDAIRNPETAGRSRFGGSVFGETGI
jgi:HEAT repeat protein